MDKLVSETDFKGYDPYDILNSPPLLALARRSRLTGVALTQAFRLIPWNLRPMLGVRRYKNAKTLSLSARSYLKLHEWSREQVYLDRACLCLDWLDEHRSVGFANACWGYSFPWCTIRQFLERDAPSIVCTSFVAHGFLDCYELTNERHYLQVARSACDFIMHDCPRIPKNGAYCFSYTPFNLLPVHNANLLGVSVLGRVYKHTREQLLLDMAMPALQYTLQDQQADGSWYYHGPYPGRDYTVDNFHTGFNLECLRRFEEDTGSPLQESIERGQTFYEQQLFDPSGAPKRKIGKQFPVDIRDAAEFLVVIGQMRNPTARQIHMAKRVLEWTVRNMQARSGYFNYLWWRNWSHSPLYPRWQAWMLWGLVNMLAFYEDSKQ